MASPADIANRVPISVCLMLATFMNSLDSTIANIALPHMQGSFSASQDQMVWVLTSYIVAGAIMTSLSGWIATRIGRKRIFLISIAGFTVASMLCGSASSLQEIVFFRVIQGLSGASLIPLSQSVMLDLYPPHQVGQIMSIWGAGTLLGPVVGPMIGGWLTDEFSWRWIFYINVPIGVLAFLGTSMFMSGEDDIEFRPFDFLGYGALAIFIGGLQLALDRGPDQDWFTSPEIWTYAVVAAIGLYLFAVQTLTADHPFFQRDLIRDRNFLTGNIFAVVISVLLFSTMALQPPMMQGLMGYSVFDAGVVMMPRGVGSVLSMLVAGRLVGKVDSRLLFMIGLTTCAVALFQMTHFDLVMTRGPMLISGFFQGFGVGFMFVPLTVLTFATLNPALRPEATSVFALIRALGQSVGISVMEALYTSSAAVAHGDIAAEVQPSNPVFAAGIPPAMSPSSPGGLAALNGEVTRQAAMVGYVDVYQLMFVGCILIMPLALLLRPARASAKVAAGVMAD